MPSPKISSKRKTISFSINVSNLNNIYPILLVLIVLILIVSMLSFQNSVAKPTVAAPSCAKVTARADNYESRKPYGHWVPVKSGHRRKHTLAMSR